MYWIWVHRIPKESLYRTQSTHALSTLNSSNSFFIISQFLILCSLLISKCKLIHTWAYTDRRSIVPQIQCTNSFTTLCCFSISHTRIHKKLPTTLKFVSYIQYKDRSQASTLQPQISNSKSIHSKQLFQISTRKIKTPNFYV